MKGTPIDSVSISKPPTKPRFGSFFASSRMIPAIVVPRYMCTDFSNAAYTLPVMCRM